MQRGNWYKADTSTDHASTDTSTDYVPTDHAPAIRMQEANDDDNKYIDWVIIQLNKRCIYGCM